MSWESAQADVAAYNQAMSSFKGEASSINFDAEVSNLKELVTNLEAVWNTDSSANVLERLKYEVSNIEEIARITTTEVQNAAQSLEPLTAVYNIIDTGGEK